MIRTPLIYAPVVMGTIAAFGFGKLYSAFTEGWVEGFARRGPDPVFAFSDQPLFFLVFTLIWAIAAFASTGLAIYAICGLVQDMRGEPGNSPEP